MQINGRQNEEAYHLSQMLPPVMLDQQYCDYQDTGQNPYCAGNHTDSCDLFLNLLHYKQEDRTRSWSAGEHGAKSYRTEWAP